MNGSGFRMSFEVPGFDIDALVKAINRADRKRVNQLVSALASNLGGDGSRLYTLSATAWVLSELYVRGGRARSGRYTEDSFLEILREVSRCSDCSDAFAALERFCLTLCDVDGGRASPRDADKQAYIRRAIEYMHQAYGDPALRMEEVAQYSYISTSYLTLLIKRETGQTFSELLTQIRMEHASRMLAETDRKAYEIAARCGFANATYFSTMFRRTFGMTPTEYRRRHKREGGLEETPNS